MTSVQKFENPVIALAGKKAADIADALTQQMILRRLIPKDTKPEDVARILKSTNQETCPMVSYPADQGSEVPTPLLSSLLRTETTPHDVILFCSFVAFPRTQVAI